MQDIIVRCLRFGRRSASHDYIKRSSGSCIIPNSRFPSRDDEIDRIVRTRATPGSIATTSHHPVGTALSPSPPAARRSPPTCSPGRAGSPPCAAPAPARRPDLRRRLAELPRKPDNLRRPDRRMLDRQQVVVRKRLRVVGQRLRSPAPARRSCRALPAPRSTPPSCLPRNLSSSSAYSASRFTAREEPVREALVVLQLRHADRGAEAGQRSSPTPPITAQPSAVWNDAPDRRQVGVPAARCAACARPGCSLQLPRLRRDRRRRTATSRSSARRPCSRARTAPRSIASARFIAPM